MLTTLPPVCAVIVYQGKAVAFDPGDSSTPPTIFIPEAMVTRMVSLAPE